jgi:hypothetical protein
MNTQDLESNDLNIILKGAISGFLIAYLVILGLRPTAEYPDNILEIIDNPWIFVILIIINFYALQWDLTIGLLLMLSIIALMLDVIIFTEGEIFNNDSSIENFNEGPNSSGPTSSRGPTSSGPTSSGPTSSGPTSSGPTSSGPTSSGPTSSGTTSSGPTSSGPTSSGPTSSGPTSSKTKITRTASGPVSQSSQQDTEANSDNELSPQQSQTSPQQSQTSSQQNSEENSDNDLAQEGPTPYPKNPRSLNDKINNIESNQYAINSKIDNIGQKVADIKFDQSNFNRRDDIQGTEIIKKTDENKQKINDNKTLLNELIEKLEDLESDDDLDETKEYIDEIAIKLTEQNNKTKEILTNIAAKLDKINSEKQVSKRPAIKRPAIKRPVGIRRLRPIK